MGEETAIWSLWRSWKNRQNCSWKYLDTLQIYGGNHYVHCNLPSSCLAVTTLVFDCTLYSFPTLPCPYLWCPNQDFNELQPKGAGKTKMAKGTSQKFTMLFGSSPRQLPWNPFSPTIHFGVQIRPYTTSVSTEVGRNALWGNLSQSNLEF